MEGLDELGCDDAVGFDYGALLQTAGGVVQYGVTTAEQEKKEKESKAEDERKAKEVIAADQAAANAVAKAMFSEQTKAASTAIDAQAAQMAITAQERASVGLSANAQKKRAEAADQTLNAVVKAAQAAPKDLYKAALVKAWTQVANKAHSGAIAATGQPGASGFDSYGGQSWFTRPVLGPLPGWSVLLIGGGVLTGVGLLVKKFFFSKAT